MGPAQHTVMKDVIFCTWCETDCLLHECAPATKKQQNRANTTILCLFTDVDMLQEEQ